MTSFICAVLGDSFEDHVLHHLHGISARLTELGEMMTNIQGDIDADTTLIGTIATSVVTIDTEVQALKAQLTALGVQPNTAALDSALADLKTKVDTASADAAPPVVTPPVVTPPPTA